MDVQMPEMDGIEATRQICMEWRNGQRPHIIALTAGVMEDERQACLDAGMEAFLNKPIVPAQLVQALEGCLPHQAETHQSTFSVSGIDAAVVEQLIADYGRPNVQDLFNTFVQDAEHQIAHIRNAINGGDTNVVARAMHALKASSSTIGAVAFAQACIGIEALAKASPTASFEREIAELHSLLGVIAQIGKSIDSKQ
jgi:HPt (histidine-containing phosphotransfer) domain-containing protein